MSTTDQLITEVIAQDKTSSVIRSVGGQFRSLTNDITESGNKGQSAFGKIRDSAAGFLAAGVVQNAAGMIKDTFVDTISKAADFDTQMSKIKATSGATDDQLKALRQTALNLGMATDVGSVSASDAANAIFELGKAGVSVDDINKGVAKSTLQLAAAAGPEFGVANAAGLAADSMNTFGLTAKDSGMIVNDLVGAANASSIGLSDLKFSLSAVGPVAHQVGMSMTDFSVAIAEMGMHGLKGSDAGTSLKTMLLNLQPSTKAATSEMQALGLMTKDGTSLFFDQTGKVKDLADIQDILKTHLAGLTPVQQEMALKTMFGTDAVRAASIMAGEGADGARKYADAVKQQGDAAAASATMSDNLQGKWEALTGTVDTIKIAIGSAFLPVLSQAADGINTVAGAVLNAVSGTGSWTDVLGIVEAGWTNLINAIIPSEGPLAGLGDFLDANFRPILIGVAGALLTVLIPAVIALAAPIIAAAAPFVALAAAIAGLKIAWDSNFLGIQSTVTNWWAMIHPVFDALGGAISRISADLGSGGLEKVFQDLPNILAPVFEALRGYGQQLFTIMGDWAGQLWQWVQTAVPPLLVQLGQWAGAGFNWLINTGVPLLVQKLGEWGTALWAWISPRIQPTLQQLGAWAGAAGTWLLNTGLPLLGSKLLEWGGALIGWIGPRIGPTLGFLGEWAGRLVGWLLTEGLPRLIGTLAGWAVRLVGWIIDSVPKLLDNLGIWYGQLVGWINSVFAPSASADMGQAGKNIIQGLIDGIGSMLSGAWDGLQRLWTNLVGSFKDAAGLHSPSTLFHGFGVDLIQGLINGIWAQKDALLGKLHDLAMLIPEPIRNILHISSPSKLFHDLGLQIPRGLANGVLAGLSFVQSAMGALGGATLVPVGGSLSAGGLSGGGSSGGGPIIVHAPFTFTGKVTPAEAEALTFSAARGLSRGLEDRSRIRSRTSGVAA